MMGNKTPSNRGRSEEDRREVAEMYCASNEILCEGRQKMSNCTIWRNPDGEWAVYGGIGLRRYICKTRLAAEAKYRKDWEAFRRDCGAAR